MDNVKVVNNKVYETSDGKLFKNKIVAEKHEEKISNQYYYEVFAEPDLNDGSRGPTSKGYIKVDARWDRKLLAKHYCFLTYGSQAAFVQGSSLCRNWYVGNEVKHVPGNKKILGVIRGNGKIEINKEG